ncbi:unnamed protein product [Calypogeia fissa]
MVLGENEVRGWAMAKGKSLSDQWRGTSGRIVELRLQVGDGECKGGDSGFRLTTVMEERDRQYSGGVELRAWKDSGITRGR